MTYYGPSELAESMRSVRGHTITIAEDIPEENYDYRPGPGSRSVRETLLHLVSMTRFDLRLHGEERLDTLEGFDFRAFFASLPIQEKSELSKAEILAALREEGEHWRRFVEQLPESILAEQVRTPRGAKTRFEMLLGTKEHEMSNLSLITKTSIFVIALESEESVRDSRSVGVTKENRPAHCDNDAAHLASLIDD
jgi:uncharacterized damage-inducible protein DinB